MIKLPMALTKQDLAAIGQVVDNKLKEQDVRFDKKLVKLSKQINGDIADTLVDIVLPQIDELGVKMEKGFDQVDNRFDKLDERLDRHGKVLESHEKRLKRVERKQSLKLS